MENTMKMYVTAEEAAQILGVSRGYEIVRGIKETGVKRIRIHDLRHSHASLLVELGFQPL